ncbi:hypothetical protein F0562_003237 [Nyssa sinensis]|uniref:Retrovirus-related Pol polyprotein from transposon TNT 1-94-like beta-barrel domain-containing protein n=1 Tax=Nyssa sinensis TaxID=561372 RepID=A0A5J5BV11_9ASTE|nr:hypothetical protein F0562_003237 [Nyssa sinensis]
MPLPSSIGVVVPSQSGFMSIKLDRTNYPLWLAQIVPILKSKNLMGFVTGTTSCPVEFKCNSDGTFTTEVDPRYVSWHQQDQMILSWVNNSLSPSVMSIVARFTSSHATWSSLEKRYASQSKNRILQLRHDLLTVKGEGLSISDFVDKINQIADNLALAGKPVDDDELVNIILNNVGPAYEITAHQTPSLEASPTAMYAPKAHHSTTRGRHPMHPRDSQMRGRGPSAFRRTPNTWSPPQSGPVSSRPPCQICHRSGHSAIDCYQRMNHAYEGRIPPQKLMAMAAFASSNPPSTTWISDSGASNHITSDLTNLALPNAYQGKDHVAVGNGAGLPIAHTGSSKFICGSSTFALQNILHCPSIAANLLSISQFTEDNNCYFVFYSDCFYVKDVKTRKTFFRRKSEHGLYPFRIHTQISTKSGHPFAFVGVLVSVPIWHSRLGHPVTNTLSRLISNKCIFINETTSLVFPFPSATVSNLVPHLPSTTSISSPDLPTQTPPTVPPLN